VSKEKGGGFGKKKLWELRRVKSKARALSVGKNGRWNRERAAIQTLDGVRGRGEGAKWVP